MANHVFSNNGSAELASGITNVAVSATVEAGKGALFPNPTGGDFAKLTIEDTLGNIEIVHLTARSGDVLTIVRAQEGTAGLAFPSGSRVELRLTKAVMDNFVQKLGGTMAGDLDMDGNDVIDAALQNPVATNLVTSSFKMSAAGATVFRIENLSAGVNAKLYSWQNDTASGDLLLWTRDDADALGRKVMQVKRNGVGVTELALGDAGMTMNLALVLGSLLIPSGSGIELGHASDTTLARLSAGVAGVEGSAIITAATLPSQTINTDQLVTDIATDANDHTVAPGDTNSIRRMTQAGGTQTVTVNSDALGGNGRAMLFIREGTAAVTFAAGGGVVIESKSGALSISIQHGAVALIQKTTNIFHLVGDL